MLGFEAGFMKYKKGKSYFKAAKLVTVLNCLATIELLKSSLTTCETNGHSCNVI